MTVVFLVVVVVVIKNIHCPVDSEGLGRMRRQSSAQRRDRNEWKESLARANWSALHCQAVKLCSRLCPPYTATVSSQVITRICTWRHTAYQSLKIAKTKTKGRVTPLRLSAAQLDLNEISKCHLQGSTWLLLLLEKRTAVQWCAGECLIWIDHQS